MSAADAEKAPQELVAGKYQLTQLLGRGGMGSVWEGTHVSLGTRVAVKFIESEYVSSPEARSRFENEARAAAKLRSKHVVQVYDHGVTADGRPFIVMEFLAGEPLDRRLDRVGRLSLGETAKILYQVCRALGRAHDARIVHRDLKPENIFLVWDEEDGADIAKVVDFGIAKFTDASMGVSSATRTGSVLGTPYYMSPEQARGLRSIDHRSDLWSVGVIAYRCVVGELPFQGEALGDLLVKLCTAPLPVPSQRAPGIPPAFDAWFTQALAREPAERFATAAQLADALNAACGVSQRPPMQSAVGQQLARAYSGAASSGLTTPAVQSGPSLPTPPTGQAPAFQSGASHPTPGVVAAQTGREAAPTGAPFTATPSIAERPSSKGPVVAAIAVLCVVLGIGVAVALKVFGGSPAAEVDMSQPSELKTPEVAQGASSPPAVSPVVPEKALEGPQAAPVASATPTTSAVPKKPSAPTQGLARSPTRPNARPARPAKPEPSKPKPPVKPGQSIDVGY